ASATVFYMNASGVYATPGNSTQYNSGNNMLRSSSVLYHTLDGISTNAYLTFAKVVRSNSTTLTSDAFIVAIPEQTEDNSAVARAGLTQTAQPYWTLLYSTRFRQFVSSLSSTIISSNPFGYEANDAFNTGAATGDPLFGIFPGSGFNQPVSFANAEAEYISFRGSNAVSFGPASVAINYAKKIGHGIYALVRSG
ncbi:MAG TPA: hypothetical protein VJI67_03175, partial [archaeon]|nr:hypothetical protein [archaeon]